MKHKIGVLNRAKITLQEPLENYQKNNYGSETRMETRTRKNGDLWEEGVMCERGNAAGYASPN